MQETYFTISYLSNITAVAYSALARQFELAGVVRVDPVTEYPCVPQTYLMRNRRFKEALERQLNREGASVFDVPSMGKEHTVGMRTLVGMLPFFDGQVTNEVTLHKVLVMGNYRRHVNNGFCRYVAKDLLHPAGFASEAEKSWVRMVTILTELSRVQEQLFARAYKELDSVPEEQRAQAAVNALRAKTRGGDLMQGTPETQAEFDLMSAGHMAGRKRPGPKRAQKFDELGSPLLTLLKEPLQIHPLCFKDHPSSAKMGTGVPRFSFDRYSTVGRVPTSKEGLAHWIARELTDVAREQAQAWVDALQEERLGLQRALGNVSQAVFESKYQSAKAAVYKDRAAWEAGVFARFLGVGEELHF